MRAAFASGPLLNALVLCSDQSLRNIGIACRQRSSGFDRSLDGRRRLGSARCDARHLHSGDSPVAVYSELADGWRPASCDRNFDFGLVYFQALGKVLELPVDLHDVIVSLLAFSRRACDFDVQPARVCGA